MNSGADGTICALCHKAGPTVRERGRIQLMAVLCDGCWNRTANALAEAEGACAEPWPDPGADDTTTVEPPRCRTCRRPVRIRRTNYDRWVHLALGDMPAQDVPSRYRWRLRACHPDHSPVVTEVVAVRLNGIDPLPGDLVVPAHRVVCVDPDAMAEVEQARREDLIREVRRRNDGDAL